MSNLMFQPFS